MNTYTLDNGLLVNASKSPPQCCGYILNFAGHGALAPDGKVQLQNGVLRDLTQGEIDEHNRLLGEMEWTALKKHGRGVLYLTRKDIPACPPSNGVQPMEKNALIISTWDGSNFCRVNYSRKSFHNFAGKDGRTDVWFNLDGSRWHGVNIGDNQICRVAMTPETNQKEKIRCKQPIGRRRRSRRSK